jgi:hypothetical protein
VPPDSASPALYQLVYVQVLPHTAAGIYEMASRKRGNEFLICSPEATCRPTGCKPANPSPLGQRIPASLTSFPSVRSACYASAPHATASLFPRIWYGLRLKYNFCALVFLVPEHFVTFRRVFQAHGVRDHKARIDVALLDPFQERLHVALDVRLTGLERQ